MSSIPRLKSLRFDPQRQQPPDIPDIVRRPHRDEQPSPFGIGRGPSDRALHIFAELHLLRLLTAAGLRLIWTVNPSSAG